MTLRAHLEIWQRYGGYLSGVTRMAVDMPDVTADQFISAMRSQNYMGGWSDTAVRRCVSAVRK